MKFKWYSHKTCKLFNVITRFSLGTGQSTVARLSLCIKPPKLRKSFTSKSPTLGREVKIKICSLKIFISGPNHAFGEQWSFTNCFYCKTYLYKTKYKSILSWTCLSICFYAQTKLLWNRKLKKYFGSFVQRNGGFDLIVIHRIKCGWMK